MRHITLEEYWELHEERLWFDLEETLEREPSDAELFSYVEECYYSDLGDYEDRAYDEYKDDRLTRDF